MADEFEEHLLRVLGGVAARFNCAEVEIVAASGPRQLRLSCSLPETCPIAMIPDPDQVDLFLGQATRVELLGRGQSIEDVVEKIRPLVEAVADGRFEETVWEGFGKTLRSSGMVRGLHGERQVVGRGGWLLGMVWPGRKRHITYEPYS
jgi:hypothetical protein